VSVNLKGLSRENIALVHCLTDQLPMNPLTLVVTCVTGWMNRHQQVLIKYLQEEVRVLHEQLGRRPRFNDDQGRRLALKAKTVGRQGLRRFARIVTPDTLLAWHRRLIAQKYDWSKMRKPGRPRTASDLQELILRMARENRSRGYTRIQGASRNLGHEVGRDTIAEILKRAGLDPAPERMNRTTWKKFLRTHWEVLAATDFSSDVVISSMIHPGCSQNRSRRFFRVREPSRCACLRAFPISTRMRSDSCDPLRNHAWTG
jgi:hypothetical protein